jgi:hypothetical protein
MIFINKWCLDIAADGEETNPLPVYLDLQYYSLSPFYLATVSLLAQCTHSQCK